MKPIILCAGKTRTGPGTGTVYGYVDGDPKEGKPVRLTKARMVIYYPSGGTFGLAVDGPPDGSRVTNAIDETVETKWQEWMAVKPEAAERFDAWE